METTNLDLWDSLRLNHQPKNILGLKLTSYPDTCVTTDVQLGLHEGPKQLELGLSQKMLPVHGLFF